MMKNNRRNFFKLTGMAGMALGFSGINDSKLNLLPPNQEEKIIKFLSPIDGDMLNEYDGFIKDGQLLTTVKISAAQTSKIRINGIKARFENNLFFADIYLKNYRNNIELVEVNTGYKENITVFWLKNYINKYRLSLDDNIWFLKDISNNSEKYKSIFENQYLAFFRQLHDTYGTKVHINIYYQTEGFNLSQMTTKFKSEWKDNSNWLNLSFHALQNDPEYPYINTGYDKVKKDCEMVREQIRRFAGEEVMGPVTTLHWGVSTVEGSRALRDLGYIVQVSDFIIENGVQDISMYLNLEQTQHITKRFIWRDNHEDIIFSRISICINNQEVDQIVPFMNELKKDPHKSGYLDLLMHEQYFYPSYVAYQPNFRQKVTTAVKWAADNGYKPAFLKECVLE